MQKPPNQLSSAVKEDETMKWIGHLFSRRCKYIGKCKLYRKNSYTCNYDSGTYCGKYKNLEYGKIKETLVNE